MSNYWIQTFTGKKLDLLEPTEDMICIEDIAHHLSITNRFVGATKYPESVAYHSINVCSLAPENLKLEGLLHDAEEAYFGDISNPFKQLLKSSIRSKHGSYNPFYDSIGKVEQLIENKFKLNWGLGGKREIKRIDLGMAMTVRDQLCCLPPELWKKEWEEAERYKITIMELQWRNVESLFLEMYNKYRRV